MELNSIILELEDDRIRFEDKLTLAFMIIGAIFFALIVVSLTLNLLRFEQVEFETPFF